MSRQSFLHSTATPGVAAKETSGITYAVLGLLSAVGLGILCGAGCHADAAERHGDDANVDHQSLPGPPDARGWNLLKLETRKRTFFKYEKRIRTLSAPPKVFSYFASVTQDDGEYMTNFDLLRSLVAVYPPEGTSMERAGSLLGERPPTRQQEDLLSVFDCSGDNLISYTEYMLMLTLVSIRLVDVKLVFDIVDVDQSGEVDHDEFCQIIRQIQKLSPQTRANWWPKKTERNQGLLAQFFGEDGTKKLSFSEFAFFLRELQERLLIMEFRHYDYKNHGSVSGWDFARSLIAPADIRVVDKYLDKVASMDPELGNTRFDQKAFLSFYVLVDYAPLLKTGSRFFEQIHGPIGEKQFAGLVQRICDGLVLSNTQLAIISHLFGNESGKLDMHGLLNCLQNRRRNFLENAQVADAMDSQPLLQCLQNCISK